MILIAESGSTKCDWVILQSSNKQITRVRTKGLNPAILKKKALQKIIVSNPLLHKNKEQINTIYFFGAGCNTTKNNQKIKTVLSNFFTNATSIIEEDMMAAVYASVNEPAIVSILGTGSNCCYYNNNTIVKKTPSLGFMVMDEGSGNYFGKELLKSYYYKKMPEELSFSLGNKFNLKEEKVIKKLYQSKTPNKYLASFAPFIFENQEHLFIKEIIKKGIQKFVENQILQFSKELETKPLHFVGSIAYHSREYITKELAKHGLKPSGFVRRPIDNLITHILKIN